MLFRARYNFWIFVLFEHKNQVLKIWIKVSQNFKKAKKRCLNPFSLPPLWWWPFPDALTVVFFCLARDSFSTGSRWGQHTKMVGHLSSGGGLPRGWRGNTRQRAHLSLFPIYLIFAFGWSIVFYQCFFTFIPALFFGVYEPIGRDFYTLRKLSNSPFFKAVWRFA